MSKYDKYEMVIGLEIHVKLNSPNKLFCKCKNEQEFDNLQPNTNICPVCSGQPGALPVLNKEPLEKAVHLWLALNCNINEQSLFDRKSYFYPDLPMGYQITQFEIPTNGEGYVEFWIKDFTEPKKIRIERAHIENDAWKTIHEWEYSLVDFNRAWTPLVEIVTYPDFRSDEEVIEFLKELQRLIRYNGIGYADMEKWQLRCDVNISVRPKWTNKLWTKVELKNINSFGAIKRAIEHEFKRQVDIIESWWEVEQQTRWWNDAKKTSFVMRSKEDALDYRYFPEPDLPPLKLEKQFIEKIKEKLVESPFSKIKRYKEQYWFNKEYINALINNVDINNFFEKLIEKWYNAKLVAKWLTWYIIRWLNDNQKSIKDLPFGIDDFAKFLDLINEWKIIDSQAKIVIMDMLQGQWTPEQIVEKRWFKPVDTGELEAVIDKVLQDNPKATEQLKQGDQKVIGFFIGQVMKATSWKADPKLVRQIILKKIK